MNRINPSKLKASKWTAVAPKGKEKHFIITRVQLDEDGKVMECELEAIVTGRIYQIDWHSLRDDTTWLAGWK